MICFSDSVGEWRSLVAHAHGVCGVAGSNPVSPTNISEIFQEAFKWLNNDNKAWLAALCFILRLSLLNFPCTR